MEDAIFLAALAAGVVISKWGIDYAARHPEGFVTLVVALANYFYLCVVTGVIILALFSLVHVFGWQSLAAGAAAGLCALCYERNRKRIEPGSE